MAYEPRDLWMFLVYIFDFKLKKCKAAVVRHYLCEGRAHLRPDSVSSNNELRVLLLSITKEKVEAAITSRLYL